MLATDMPQTHSRHDSDGLLTSALREQAADQQYLTLKGLAKRFGKTRVFSDIDAEIARGEFITLLGPSGCGKSTLLRAIAGLNDVDSGEIIVDGHDITRLPPQRRGIGMVFQHYALFPNMRVADNVAFGLRMKKVRPEERERRVTEVLRLVELTDQAQRYPHQLSGGQRQRVALARALVVEPQILLLDEPLSALDARIRRHLRDQIRDIQKSLGLTTLFVTHDQEEALLLSDRIFLMHQGSILQQGNAASLYTRPVDATAAGFMGHYNLIGSELARPLLGYLCDSPQVALRPEALYLQPDEMTRPLLPGHLEAGLDFPLQPLPANVGPALPGVILRHQLLGNIVRYEVDCQGLRLNVDVLNRSARQLLPDHLRVQVHADLDEVQALGTHDTGDRSRVANG
ncbi:ABC transporter ATP-binding protein [Cobetia sp. 14N.309.X.WAT.E.A4]|uniref:ABC transporter ATP-binding protein n=1 Tax=Cobetia TaxID=204286 RepID=UPI00196A15FF|nr:MULTISPECIES: ABC transporter ATP-binding protein [Cobetia]MDN2656688.1 ABC transporter ATP-binding protein [Cobetia sp. 14N.309.X.WAT.E.A4]